MTESEIMVEAFAENIWIADGQRIKMLGIPFDIRMTIIKLSDSKLWVHSPVQPSESLYREVMSLGEVSHIVAPNKLHHLYVKPWSERFLTAKVWAGPELAKRNLDIYFDEMLDDFSPPDWSDDIDQIIFKGSAFLPEAIFYHKQSKTLLLTDLIQNHDPSKNSWAWAKLKKLNGVLAPDGGVPIDLRLTFLDRKALRESLDKMLSWDFQNLIMAHGICIEKDARSFVHRALQWAMK